MLWNKPLSKKCNLYLILDTDVAGYDRLLTVTDQAVKAGVDIVQLRDKRGADQDIIAFSKEIRSIIQGKVPYIMNDRADLAMQALADGVHVGQQDMSYAEARRLMGPQALIGVSCQSLEHALKAQAEGADYLGFGSVFKTQTKPDRQPMETGLLTRVVDQVSVPLFAIGGITLGNIDTVISLGVRRIAVCREILQADDVAGVVRSFKEQLGLKDMRG